MKTVPSTRIVISSGFTTSDASAVGSVALSVLVSVDAPPSVDDVVLFSVAALLPESVVPAPSSLLPHPTKEAE